jgi:hypothetical protein
MSQVRAEALAPNVLEVSMDAKAAVAVGEFSRKGTNRIAVKALDHDFTPETKVTPYGLFLPAHNALHITLTPSKVTADFQVDCLADFWRTHRATLPEVDTLQLLLDNGPENHSRRTQFLARIVEFSHAFGVKVRLAYYPPYHSKYNPVERTWGILEKHWNGTLLDSVDTVVSMARTMTYNGVRPVVTLCKHVYETGKKLTKKAMAAVEAQVLRHQELPAYFVDITPPRALC